LETAEGEEGEEVMKRAIWLSPSTARDKPWFIGKTQNLDPSKARVGALITELEVKAFEREEIEVFRVFSLHWA